MASRRVPWALAGGRSETPAAAKQRVAGPVNALVVPGQEVRPTRIARPDRGFRGTGTAGPFSGVPGEAPPTIPGSEHEPRLTGARSWNAPLAMGHTNRKDGAGDGNRTHDIQLGKLTFYL